MAVGDRKDGRAHGDDGASRSQERGRPLNRTVWGTQAEGENTEPRSLDFYNRNQHRYRDSYCIIIMVSNNYIVYTWYLYLVY